MYGLILMTCLTINTHCNDDNAPMSFDVIDHYTQLVDCKKALLAEPKARQEFLMCEVSAPYEAK